MGFDDFQADDHWVFSEVDILTGANRMVWGRRHPNPKCGGSARAYHSAELRLCRKQRFAVKLGAENRKNESRLLRVVSFQLEARAFGSCLFSPLGFAADD